MSNRPIRQERAPNYTQHHSRLDRTRIRQTVIDKDGNSRDFIEVDSIRVGQTMPIPGKSGITSVVLQLTDEGSECPIIMAYMLTPDQADIISDSLKRVVAKLRGEAAAEAAAALDRAAKGGAL